MRRKGAALSHQRHLGQTCKNPCKDKAHRSEGRLVWGDCKTLITESFKHMPDKYLSRRTDVLLTLPSSYRLFYKIFIQYLIS